MHLKTDAVKVDLLFADNKQKKLFDKISKPQAVDLLKNFISNTEQSVIYSKPIDEHFVTEQKILFEFDTKVCTGTRKTNIDFQGFNTTKCKLTTFENEICAYMQLLYKFEHIIEVMFFIEGTEVTAFLVLDEVCLEKTSKIAYTLLDYEVSSVNCSFKHVYFEQDEISTQHTERAVAVFTKK